MVTLYEAADDPLYLWAKTAHLTKGGEILFQTDLGIRVLRINFSNAYCNGLISEIDHMIGTITSLKITPEIVTLNGVELDNKW